MDCNLNLNAVDGVLIGSNNYIASQGIQMVDTATNKRVKLDRAQGRMTVNELVIEATDRQTKAVFRVEGNKLKLYKSNGTTLSKDWDV